MKRKSDFCGCLFRRAVKHSGVLAFALLSQTGCRSIETPKATTPSPLTGSHVTPAKQSIISVQYSFEKAPATSRESAVIPNASLYPVDLPAALALAGADNPTIMIAQEAIATRRAERLQADALLLPTLRAGADYDGHTGNLESSRGVFRPTDRQSAYVGAGAGPVGASTVPIPGVRIVAPLADAIYQPLVARQRVKSAEFDARATRNSILGDVAIAYLELLGAEAKFAAIRQSEAEFREIVQTTADFARAGQGRDADANRATGAAALLRTESQRADEEVAIASANLARLLSLDQSTRLQPIDESLQLIEIVDDTSTLESLIQVATANRPEIVARSADVQANQARWRAERVRPFLPYLSAGYSAGGFGGGSDAAPSELGPLKGRGDFDAVAVWSLANCGFGNQAIQKQRRAEVVMAEADRFRAIDRVRREVAEAQADSVGRRQIVDAAGKQLRTAEEGFRLDMARSKTLEGRPIEVLNSANLVFTARQELIRAIVGYNQAQFRLFVALGQPPSMATEPLH